jgi:hypothetical protein
MRTLKVLALAAIFVAIPAAAPAALAAAPAAAAPAGAAPRVEVTLDRTQASVGVGGRITVQARVVNSGTVRTDRLIAHLNVATLDQSVYVDLEDWTGSPTQELAPLEPGADTTATFEIQAVNVGRFDVYVVVAPSGASAGRGPLVASTPELVQVAARRTVTPGGVLPVAITAPVLLGLASAGLRLRRWRWR